MFWLALSSPDFALSPGMLVSGRGQEGPDGKSRSIYFCQPNLTVTEHEMFILNVVQTADYIAHRNMVSVCAASSSARHSSQGD